MWIVIVAILIDVAYSFLISDVFVLTSILLSARAVIVVLYKVPEPRVGVLNVWVTHDLVVFTRSGCLYYRSGGMLLGQATTLTNCVMTSRVLR